MKRLFAGGMFLLLANLSFADDSTINAGSKGDEPLNVKAGEQSPVRMVSEDLEFHFSTDKTRVVATFHFLNPTASTVHHTIGFPDEGLAAQMEAGGKVVEGDGVPGPIQEMTSFVNGRELDSKVEYGYVKRSPDNTCWLPAAKGDHGAGLMAWHILAVDFPPGKEVIVERRYTVDDGGENGGVYFFTYTVHTGSSWQGKIGRLRATVFLEGGLTVDELGWTKKILRGDYLVEPSRKEWKIVSPKKMTLEWDNFKPSEEEGKQEIEISARDKKLDAEMLKAGQPLPTAD